MLITFLSIVLVPLRWSRRDEAAQVESNYEDDVLCTATLSLSLSRVELYYLHQCLALCVTRHIMSSGDNGKLHSTLQAVITSSVTYNPSFAA
jgi:hypothetical protein